MIPATQTAGLEQSNIMEKTVRIAAPRDWALDGTLFEPVDSSADGPIVLMSAAAAVPHNYYAPFCRHLVANGARAALTYDYRGIGASRGDRKRWPELAMKDWALLDFPAAARWLQERFPDASLVGMGHSYGGQALGLSGIANRFERFATVATMSGYWRNLDEPWSVRLKTRIIGASFARIMGRIPRWGGLGEEMPGSIFLDWTRWISHTDYFFEDPDLPEVSRFAEVDLPFLSIGISDDLWGTRLAVHNFMKHYENADLREIWIEPSESGHIGHLGFFRRRHEAHWAIPTNFILTGDWPESVEPQASTRSPSTRK